MYLMHSTVFCLLVYQTIGALFTNIKIPVQEHPTTRFPVWLESTNIDTCTLFPLGSGAFGGIASFMSP